MCRLPRAEDTSGHLPGDAEKSCRTVRHVEFICRRIAPQTLCCRTPKRSCSTAISVKIYPIILKKLDSPVIMLPFELAC